MTFVSKLMIAMAALAQALVALPAYSQMNDGAISEVRTERKTASATTTIQGELICQMGNQNNGQACRLELKENGTGRVYNLQGNTQAMRLYQDGTRKVAIRGTMNGEVFQITQTEAL